jgi:hypothetical protein
MAEQASVADRTYVTFAGRGRLGIDIGGEFVQPVRRLAARRAEVTETADGSRLVVPAPAVEVVRAQPVRGQLRLGRLPVPATLTTDEEGRTVLEAWVSGMPGRSQLFTKFAPSEWADSGTLLVIDGVGGMWLRGAQPRRPAKRAAVAPPATTLVGRARARAGRVRRRVLREVAARRARR